MARRKKETTDRVVQIILKDKLHTKLKVAAALEGVPMQSVIIDAITQALRGNSKGETQ